MGKEIFNNIPSKVSELISEVETGKIGLPDLQRPFVWKDNKVRDLLDSMMKGYPIGYIMLWKSPEDYDSSTYIGLNNKTHPRPHSLLIDGQQRLTALLAAMTGVKVKDKNYKDRQIKISFNPLTREFGVWTKAYEKDPEWISEISSVFQADKEHNVSKFRRKFIAQCNAGREKNNREELTDDEKDLIEDNLKDLLDLSGYLLPTLDISSHADEEDVAEIFVRVNSGGQKLTENHFIETLLAVYDQDVHELINQFCEESRKGKDGTSYNHILNPDPVHLIRMAVGVGFKRARLHYAYMMMRGKDLKTGQFSGEEMEKNLAVFKEALAKVTDLNNWHAFMGLFSESGYLNSSLIASTNAVVFCYVLYLIGKYEYKVPAVKLRRIIRKWIFMSTVTRLYTGSAESESEKHFADLKSIQSADQFVSYLEGIIAARFSEDYFNITLPLELNTSAANSPAWFAYNAALNILGTQMWLSTTTLASKMIPGANGKKKSLDKHHIFPKEYLTSIGYESDRERNQTANYTFLDFNTNIDISDNPPSMYAGKYRKKLGEEAFAKTCLENAIPENFDQLSYEDFLDQRRRLMANIIRKAYQKLCEE